MKDFRYAVPESLDEALAILDQRGDEARIMAGGTALVILMRQGLVQPGMIVNLGRLSELRGIEARDGGLRIGALTTHTEVETSPLVRERQPMLAGTIHHVATVRIRNVGTIGGNLAHADPNQDPPVSLIALDATVDLVSSAGQRSVPLDELFTDYYETLLRPDEVLRAIHVPALVPGSVAVFHKFLPRTADDYATVAVAVVVRLDAAGERCEEARVVLGSVGSTPIRARAVEAALRGQRLTPPVIRDAAALVAGEVDPVTDIRGSAEYKRDMAEVWVRRALTRAVADGATAHRG